MEEYGLRTMRDCPSSTPTVYLPPGGGVWAKYAVLLAPRIPPV